MEGVVNESRTARLSAACVNPVVSTSSEKSDPIQNDPASVFQKICPPEIFTRFWRAKLNNASW